MSAAWILTFVSIVVAVCAALAALGFRGRVSTIGVDLGTTFSVVGVSINGKVMIIEDKNGNKIFPSVVAFENDGSVAAVSYGALPYLSMKPQNTIYNAKRFMGGNLVDETTIAYAAAHPYKVIPANLANNTKVGFELPQIGTDTKPIVVTPENVGTQVLKHLLSLTATFLGHNQVNKAVICVPAKFTPAQRAATGEAYKAAGLKVVRVLEEPTAAAVAYKLHKKSNIHHILVYDFGGGTLDVSLLFVSKGSVQVYATDGDETLGGSDLDTCLYDIIKTQVEKLSGGVVIDMKSISEGESIKTDATTDSIKMTKAESDSGMAMKSDNICNSAALRSKAENAKKLLSYSNSTTISCNLPSPVGISNESQEVKFELSREQFEVGCQHLFERGLAPVIRLLSELEMTKDDIDEVRTIYRILYILLTYCY